MVWKQWIAHGLGAITISSHEVNWQVLKKKQELLFHMINNYTVEVIDTKCECQNPRGRSKAVSEKLMQERVILHKEAEIH